jgi:hypothetical protein
VRGHPARPDASETLAYPGIARTDSVNAYDLLLVSIPYSASESKDRGTVLFLMRFYNTMPHQNAEILPSFFAIVQAPPPVRP